MINKNIITSFYIKKFNHMNQNITLKIILQFNVCSRKENAN